MAKVVSAVLLLVGASSLTAAADRFERGHQFEAVIDAITTLESFGFRGIDNLCHPTSDDFSILIPVCHKDAINQRSEWLSAGNGVQRPHLRMSKITKSKQPNYKVNYKKISYGILRRKHTRFFGG